MPFMSKRKRPLFAGYTAFLVVLLLNQESCAGQLNHHCEQPSPCGNLTNISYPFRLKGDPPNCGDPNYELTCQNNYPILNLYAGKYYVKEINYTNRRIRIADIGLQEENCSSLPLYHLNIHNFSFRDLYVPHSSSFFIFLCCQNPVKSPLYVDAYPSINENISCSRSSSSSSTKTFRYVIPGHSNISEIGDSCGIESEVMTIVEGKFSSYVDVHSVLVNGFELSWWHIQCQECKGQGFCYLIDTAQVVQCSDPCSFSHISSLNCAREVLSEAVWIVLEFLELALPTLIGLCMVIRICLAPCIYILLFYKWRRRHLSVYRSVEEFIQSHNNFMPIRYSSSEIKRMTNNFKEKLGEGGYGSVYKGKLRSGSFVAVKMLGKAKGNGQGFINEVATIGRIHHVNVVRLVGFYSEGSKHALVYDFMPNGSLDKYVFSREGNTILSWQKMYEISLGVAHGIEYLHRGCDMQILHFDIKPHNVLLDENFIPKVSDFGLAKLCSTNNNTVSMTAARGTIGYIAPELFYKNIGSVSHKADVYSFGMLLMEMAGQRKSFNKVAEEENSSQIYFPSCVFNKILYEKDMELGDATEEEKKIAKKMVIVALWCIQMNPDNRPPMHKVVEMLEQEVETLILPPKCSLTPERRMTHEVGVGTKPTWSSSTTIESTESISLAAIV